MGFCIIYKLYMHKHLELFFKITDYSENKKYFLKFGLVDWLAVQKVVQILVLKLTVI